MTNKHVYAYRIPDRFFKPHTVKSPFNAKVIYRIEKGQPVIEEVGLSPKCLTFISNTADMMTNIEGELIAAIRKAKSLQNINTTIASALAPHI